jgi:hypothetical protein
LFSSCCILGCQKEGAEDLRLMECDVALLATLTTIVLTYWPCVTSYRTWVFSLVKFSNRNRTLKQCVTHFLHTKILWRSMWIIFIWISANLRYPRFNIFVNFPILEALFFFICHTILKQNFWNIGQLQHSLLKTIL